MLAGKAKAAAGCRRSRGNPLTIRLTTAARKLQRAPGAVAVCVLPTAVGADPEGVEAARAHGGPVRDHRVRPRRPGRDREESLLPRLPAASRRADRHRPLPRPGDRDSTASIAGGSTTRGSRRATTRDRATELQRKYGLNKKRFFAVPASFLRYFVLNTSRPLFRDNARLRRAVNFAIDRPALSARTAGRSPAFSPISTCRRACRVSRTRTSTRSSGPNVATARQLASGATRGGNAVLYAPANTLGSTQAADRQGEPREDRARGHDQEDPGNRCTSRRSPRRESRSTSPGPDGSPTSPIPSLLNDLFAGENSPDPNSSRFDSPAYNARLDRASRLVGPTRYATYGRLDVDLARNAAPAIAYAYDNALTLVRKRVGLHRPQPVSRPRRRLPEVATAGAWTLTQTRPSETSTPTGRPADRDRS